jgi:allophanate hydrolase subunit 1
VIDVVPGIRSLQVHFDGLGLDQQAMLAALIEAEERLGDLEDFTIPSRIVHLPLSWRDPATLETIQKYMGAVRDDAPWCPDNIEFIRRINGLPDTAAVENLIFEANYLVMGLGDVYLGAPVATPVDPRHRWSPPSTTRRAPGRRPMSWASAAPICASMAWKGRAATSCSAAPSRCGTPTARPTPLSKANPGCCASSTRSGSIR